MKEKLKKNQEKMEKMATKKETKQKHPETSGELYNVDPRGVRSSLVDIYLRIYQKNSMLKFRHRDKKTKHEGDCGFFNKAKGQKG